MDAVPGPASVHSAGSDPVELAFLRRHGVPDADVETAARLAIRWGVTGDLAIVRAGLLDEVRYYRALAAEAGLPFRDTLDDVHAMARFPESVLTGLVPLTGGGPLPARFAWAPRGASIGRLLSGAMRLGPAIAAIAPPGAVRDAVMAVRAVAIADRAADGLARLGPDLSFRSGATPGQVLAAFVGGGGAVLATLWWPDETALTFAALITTAFLASAALRIATVLEPAATGPDGAAARLREADLPVYTVLVPLYREARVLPKLLRALAALDYPAAKLDVKILVEAGDGETRAALAALRRPGFVEVVVVPPGVPRTKPRALNVGLDLAAGEFVAVYDAEDVPDPDQLRLAVSLFDRAPGDVVCLQARLVIDNADDTLFTRLFAIEYAALFDVINPALARFDLPVPLGGTSNHFRTAVLRGLGGWDAWNVTEDADLGIRLAAAGYRVGDLPSATLEEAPRSLRPWMHQRTRWMKGFLQVAITHSRRPVGNLRNLGPVRLGGATSVTLGTVLSAFGFPFFTAAAAEALASGRLVTAATPLEILAASLSITLLCAGVVALTLPPLEALRRRRWWSLLPFVPLVPLYYGLVSIAAWRGLFELLAAPARWNKTEHGLARTSRAARLTGGAGGPGPPPPEDAPR